MASNTYLIPIIGPLEKKKNQNTVPSIQTIPTVENISTTKDSKPSTVVGFPQRSDSSGNRTLNTTSGDVVWGSLKESLGNALSGISTLLQSTQGENLLRDEKMKQEQNQKKYDQMLAENQKKPGTWDPSVLDTKAKELETNQRMLDAGEKGIADSPILQGVNQVRDVGADLALSGAQDIARAKENTNGFGRFMVDVGAARNFWNPWARPPCKESPMTRTPSGTFRMLCIRRAWGQHWVLPPQTPSSLVLKKDESFPTRNWRRWKMDSTQNQIPIM